MPEVDGACHLIKCMSELGYDGSGNTMVPDSSAEARSETVRWAMEGGVHLV